MVVARVGVDPIPYGRAVAAKVLTPLWPEGYDMHKWASVHSNILTPLIFLMWILGAATLHVASKLFGGSGTFENIFRMTGYSLWAPWYLLIIVDSIHSTPQWLYNTVLAICIALIYIGTVIAARTEQKIGIAGSVVVTTAAFITVAGRTFTYIR